MSADVSINQTETLDSDRQEFIDETIQAKFEVALIAKTIETMEDIAEERIQNVIKSAGLNSTKEQQLAALLNEVENVGMVEVLLNVLGEETSVADDEDSGHICSDCKAEEETGNNN